MIVPVHHSPSLQFLWLAHAHTSWDTSPTTIFDNSFPLLPLDVATHSAGRSASQGPFCVPCGTYAPVYVRVVSGATWVSSDGEVRFGATRVRRG